MKYRIKQVGNKFYPQSRICLFFWREFIGNNNSYFPSKVVKFSLQDARDFIDDHIENQRTIIHKYP